MVAGLLAQSGYNTGNNYIAQRSSNPKGFFEDRDVNRINDELLRDYLKPRVPRRIGRLIPLYTERPHKGWLAEVPIDPDLQVSETILSRMKRLLRQQPYCYKDPRFCYTIPAWRPHLRDAVFVCIFREPIRTARSIVKESQTAPNLKDVSVSLNRALRLWFTMYSHLVERHRHEGDWLFVHFDQVVEGTGIQRLERHLGVSLDITFVEPQLKRSDARGKTPREIEALYQRLCDLAQFESLRT